MIKKIYPKTMTGKVIRHTVYDQFGCVTTITVKRWWGTQYKHMYAMDLKAYQTIGPRDLYSAWSSVPNEYDTIIRYGYKFRQII